MAYTIDMIIIETPIFTKYIVSLIADDEYKDLQGFIVNHPDAGKVIPHTHGLRKLRWAGKGHGKRGGLRIIYYWYVPNTIFMLIVYAKADQEDLTTEQLKKLSQLVKEWLL